jgi:hypothetical protein
MNQITAGQIAASIILSIKFDFSLDLISRSNSRIAEAQAAHRSAGKHFWREKHAKSAPAVQALSELFQ